MKRLALMILVLVSIVLIFAGCETTTAEYEIMMDDEIEIYEGQQLKLRPYLIDQNGEVMESRFVYSSSSNSISVTQDGEIIINTIPTEDVYITITDRNTSTEKKVKVIIVQSVVEIDGITDANNKLIDGLQSVILGEEYKINVKTPLLNFSAEDYCTINITDSSGTKLKAFDITYNKNVIALKATGLGKATAEITFKDNGGAVIYTDKIDFEISTKDKVISNVILTTHEKESLSSVELGNITQIVLPSTASDISELRLLKSLDTVVFASDEIMQCDGISDDYTYRVKASLLKSYMEDENWSSLFGKIIPYENNYNERYIVYRSEKSTELSYGKIDGSFRLKVLSYQGYTNTGWKTQSGSGLSDEQVKEIEKNGIHAFAVWSANENEVIFNSNDGANQSEVIKARTDSTIDIPENTFVRAGYTFVGWSKSTSGEAQYQPSDKYKVEPHSQILFYAIWKANENTIVFNANGGSGEMSPAKVDTDETISLPANEFVRAGYTFMGWSTTSDGEVAYENGASYKMGSEPSVTLYAVWAANENKIIFNDNIGGPTKEIQKNTDEVFNLPLNEFVRAGYTFMGWAKSKNSSDVDYIDGAEFTMSSSANVTLYAVWAANLNTIVFDSNNGKNETTTQKAYTDSTITLNANEFVYKNYSFIGWSTTADGEVEFVDAASYKMGPNAQYTLYAVWEENEIYSIEYVYGEGEQNPNNLTEYRVDSDPITLYAPSRAGYTFICWCSDQELTTRVDIIPTGSTGDKVFYAKWQANTNTLYFNANGGSGSMEPMQICTDGTVHLSANNFTKLGYTFAGWKTTIDGEEIEYYDEKEYTMGPNSEYTLYAIWTLDEYKVSYELNQGTNDATNPTEYTVHTATILLKDPLREGYTFKGWYTDSGFTTKLESIEMGSTGNLTLYAKWQANTNTLKFDANDGRGVIHSVNVDTDQTIYLDCVPVRKGYTFVGWKTVADEAIGAELSNGDQYTMGTESEYTLYAVWSTNTYRITYEMDGGTNHTLNPSTYTVTSDEIVLSNPTKTGYDFAYWEDSAGKKLEGNTIPTGSVGDIVLYAKWSPKSFTLTYNANGGTGTMASVTTTVGAQFNLSSVAFTNGTKKFAGWSTSPSGAAKYADGELFTMGTSNVNLYAVWATGDYTIQWVLNGGQNSINNPTGYTSAQGVPQFHNPDARTGYTFVGWYSDSTLTTPITGIAPGKTGNITVYAKWTPNTYIVTIDPNGGTVSSSTKNVTFDANYGNLPTPVRAGYTFVGWYNGTTLVTSTSKVVTANNHTLEARWKVNTYKVSFNANGGAGDTSAKTVVFDGNYGTLPTVTRAGYKFLGWYYNGTRIYDTTKMTVAADHILVAEWEANKYTIKLDPNGGSVSLPSITITYSDGYNGAARATYGTLPTPTRTGYTFKGWTYKGTTVNANTEITAIPTEDLVAQWEIIYYTITITTGGSKGGYITDGDGNKIASGSSYPYSTQLTLNVKYNGDIDHSWTINGTKVDGTTSNITITGNVSVVVTSNQSCIASGTLVTLADGTQKKVEDLKEDDILLVFNHETGKYEPASILFIERDGWKEYSLINLEFSNGSKTRIIYEHALFDVTLNKYVYITSSNYYEYVGHEFAILDDDMSMTTVTLENSYLTWEYAGCYSLITSYHANYFIDGLLSIPGGMDGLFNYFEYGEDLAYDSEKMAQDIAEYGLYTYEDFADYVPYEVFEYMFPAKYYKVAVGKGLITFEEIVALIQHYLVTNGYA